MTTNKTKWCGLNEVIRNWNFRPIAVEMDDGTDCLLQENGYTVEDAIKFAGRGFRFFYDD